MSGLAQYRRARWLLLAAAIACVAVILFPIYWILLTSLVPSSIMLSRSPPLLPPLGEISFAAYWGVFARKPILTWIANSIFVTLGTMTVSLVVSAMAGYSLSRFRTAAQQSAGFALLVSKMMPSSLVVIPFFIMFSRIGLIESHWGLILANSAIAVPFASWMLKGFFDAIPRELEQAAMLDGCNEMQSFRHIVLPLAAPGMAASAIYIAIVTWADLVFARTLMSQPGNWLITVGIQSFAGEHLVEWSALTAAAMISLAPVLILFLLLEPYLLKGMTQGSLAN